ncbi:MAG: aldo/keto reductase [Halobacteriaceae archaeon]
MFEENERMEYVEFGDTGERVSRLGFGGAPAGLENYLDEYDPGDPRARREVVEAIRRALELGVNYFDTAPGYGDGTSEELFGEALADEDEDDVFVATKVDLGDRDHVRSSVEASLDRLRRDRIDLLQVHGSSYSPAEVETVLEGGTLAEMEALREEGKVGYLGFTSEDNNPAVYDLLDRGTFDALQLNYNLIFQHPYVPDRPFGTLFEAEDRGLGTVTMRTTTSGIFQSWVEEVNPDNEFDYTPALIQFVLSNPLVDVALVGMRTAEIVEENVEIVADESGRVDIDDLFERYV